MLIGLAFKFFHLTAEITMLPSKNKVKEIVSRVEDALNLHSNYLNLHLNVVSELSWGSAINRLFSYGQRTVFFVRKIK